MSDKTVLDTSGIEPYLIMSPKTRQGVEILICEERINDRNNMKMALRSLNYGRISDAPSLGQGIKKIETRNFSHIIFQARKSDIAASEFLQSALLNVLTQYFSLHPLSRPSIMYSRC